VNSLPNTYTLKVTGWPLIERIENGMGFVRPFLAEVWVLLVLAGTALLFDFRKGKLLLAGVFVVALLYQGVDRRGRLGPLAHLLARDAPDAGVGRAGDLPRRGERVGTAGFRGFFERNPVVARRHVPGLVSALAVLAVLWS
jgi:hypothetical protein